MERVEESDRVTENHGNRRGATNGDFGTGERLTIRGGKNRECRACPYRQAVSSRQTDDHEAPCVADLR